MLGGKLINCFWGEEMKEDCTKIAEAMRQYIVEHLQDGISAADVARAMGYSERQAARLFYRATGKSIGQYIRLLRLSAAAQNLGEKKERVLDVALAHQYDSHEGFTKAFASAFGISPKAYRKGGKPIQYFIPYPLSYPESMFVRKDGTMNNTVTATIQARPKRKMILLYSKTGTDYWSFCQEMGCDWEGLLLSIPERMDTPAFLTLPERMIPKGSACGAVGIELPEDYAGEIPQGYEMIDLPAGEMMYFQSPPYEKEDAFPEAIALVFAAFEQYRPEDYGYRFALDQLPMMNFGAFADKGAKIAVPLEGVKA